MSNEILTLDDIRRLVKPLAEKYRVDEVYLFGSYARKEPTATSDIDLLVFGGDSFKPTSIFAFAEELRMVSRKEVDAFEISEVERNSSFYNTIMKEKVKVA